mmetsp:Transcript_115131/g.365786  ORF Transcript_115131/g.365786 Transcript_115131/m.365786 type:complete len:296 (-) Transcript_115131:252-1139(-)
MQRPDVRNCSLTAAARCTSWARRRPALAAATAGAPSANQKCLVEAPQWPLWSMRPGAAPPPQQHRCRAGSRPRHRRRAGALPSGTPPRSRGRRRRRRPRGSPPRRSPRRRRPGRGVSLRGAAPEPHCFAAAGLDIAARQGSGTTRRVHMLPARSTSTPRTRPSTRMQRHRPARGRWPPHRTRGRIRDIPNRRARCHLWRRRRSRRPSRQPSMTVLCLAQHPQTHLQWQQRQPRAAASPHRRGRPRRRVPTQRRQRWGGRGPSATRAQGASFGQNSQTPPRPPQHSWPNGPATWGW